MNYPKIAAQMYTVRDFAKTPEGIKESLRKIKEAGYDAVQISGLGPIDDHQLKDMADEYGLYICATHINYESFAEHMDEVIAQHKLWDCKYVGIGGMPGRFQGSAEGFAAFAKEASGYAKILADNGLRFIYHNHSFEFRKFGDHIGMEILLEESDPDVFDFELDTYWVQHGGGDPIQWINNVKGRMDVIHYKDMTMGPEWKQLMAEIGEGNLNWKGITDACAANGVKWACVEQDVCQRDPFESLAISRRNLKSMGLRNVTGDTSPITFITKSEA